MFANHNSEKLYTGRPEPAMAGSRPNRRHYLKHSSNFIVVVLRSLQHGACVNWGEHINSWKESLKHWNKALLDNQGILFDIYGAKNETD